MITPRYVILLVSLTLILSGCASRDATNPFAPASPLAGNVVRQWEKDLVNLDLRDYRDEPKRSALIYRLIFLSDYKFSRYEADLMLGKATRDTFVDLSMFGLNSAASLITPGEATQILSAIAGGLGFTRSTIERNFYMNHAAPVLIARMRVLRKEKLNEIAANLRQSPRTYPVELAIVDVLDYYNRGTMLGALQSVSQETSIQEVRTSGGEVRRAPPAPPVRLLFQKTAAPVIEGKLESLNAARLSSDVAQRRKTLGSQVIRLRKADDQARAEAILAAGGITAPRTEAIRRLADIVDSISTRTTLQHWEQAFAARPSGPAFTPPVEVSDPINPLIPGKSKAGPTAPIPKVAPVHTPQKIEPL